HEKPHDIPTGRTDPTIRPRTSTPEGQGRTAMRISAQTLARTSARHPWRVIGAWIALSVVGRFLTSQLLAGALTTQADCPNDPEAKQAQTLLEQRLTGPRHSQEIVIVRSEGATVDDPAFRSYVEQLQG